jgi:signal transduction histidine kinase/DNA-binding response OmpR family regulator
MKLLQPEIAYIFVGGFYLAMSVLHFILYMYNRQRKANLIYSAGMWVAFLNFTLVPISTAENFTETSGKLNILLSTASNGALLYFISYYVIAYKVPSFRHAVRYYGVFYMTGLILLLVTFSSETFFYPIDTFLRSSLYLVVVISCVIGILKKVPNFYLIVVATLLLLVTDLFIRDLLNLWGGNYPMGRLLIMIIGYTAPFIAYSTYLSKDLALTGKKLEHELIMNERLSRAKYEQELVTRKLIEAQKVELERSVQERTREITNQKKEIEKQAEKIREIDKIKSRFFANISHEFRTPLTLILGPAKKLLAQAARPDEIRDLSIIRQNAGRLLQLVNQLLDLTKIESGALSMKIAKTELIGCLKPTVEAFQSLAEVKMVRFKFEYQAFAIPIFLDVEKVEKVMNNLLSNAFKFTPAGGTVSVTVCTRKANERFRDGFAEIEVNDTGIGIAREHLPKIFNRFYQVDNSQTRDYEGTGIGLAITKEFTELMHGEISVVSEIGTGTTFTLRFPLGNSVMQNTGLASENQQDSDQQLEDEMGLLANLSDNHARETILIIEDNVDLRYYIRDNLPENYHILEAPDGEKGIELALDNVPDLIISDIMMPKRDGIEVCRAIKNDERTSHIPVILLTAKTDLQDKLDGLNTGADDYIPKPFDVNELVIRTRNLIETRKKLREKFTGKIAIKPKEISVQSVDDRFLQKVISIAEENIGNSQFSVEKFSMEAGMSVAQLYRKLNALTGYTPNDFIRHMRLQRAADLFQQKVGNVADVAYQVGFNNLSYFAKCFKEKFGMSPSQFNA